MPTNLTIAGANVGRDKWSEERLTLHASTWFV
jgi:hypothetical protein